MSLPFGFHYATADDFSGYDRDYHTVENIDELELLFADRFRHQVTCGWCGSGFEPRSVESARDWFRAHDCSPLERVEAAGIVWDLAA